jgi:hypothetical protein
VLVSTSRWHVVELHAIEEGLRCDLLAGVALYVLSQDPDAKRAVEAGDEVHPLIKGHIDWGRNGPEKNWLLRHMLDSTQLNHGTIFGGYAAKR